MDKPNIAFALLSAVLGIYICAALLLTRMRERSRVSPPNKAARRPRAAADNTHKRTG